MINTLWENIFKKDRKEKTLLEALKSNHLFQDLTLQELQMVKKIVNFRSYLPEEIIFREGEPGVGMYIILQGSVDIMVDISTIQKDHSLSHLGPGDFFGEMALLEKTGRRSATAIATSETQLIGFFKPDLFEILQKYPSVGVKILLGLSEVMALRLIETNTQVTHLEKKLKSHV